MSDNEECVLAIEGLGHFSHDEAEMDERIRELKNLMERARIQLGERPPPKIQKVPFILRRREKFVRYYEPRVVSVGPIHYGKPTLLTEYKPRLVAWFINQSGQKMEALYKIIDDKIYQLRDYYHEDVHKAYDDKTLSWILFLDGCSVLQFIYGSIHGKLDAFMIKTDHIAFMRHDLFLLENQIPFQVLRLLMDSSIFGAELKNSIEIFIRANVMASQEYKDHLKFNLESVEPIPLHLLDLLHHASFVYDKMKKKKELVWYPSQQSFHNIQELKAVGIDFKPSESGSLRSIHFESYRFTGRLYLPQMLVGDSTASLFLNLIAYESCPDNFRTKYEVTSYISFLDSLIDHANDVKELRSAQILQSSLGSDEEVASLFNEIGIDLVPDFEIYGNVRVNVMRYYKSKWMIKLAESYHSHFSSPGWTVLAFVGALLALTMSAIQTWFVVFPPSDPTHSRQH